MNKFIPESRITIIKEIPSRDSLTFKRIIKTTCIYCKRDFYSGSPRSNNCGFCKVELKCRECGNFLEIKNRPYNFFKRDFLCKPCSDKLNHMKAHTKKANKLRNDTLIKSGARQKWIDSGHTKEAKEKQNIARIKWQSLYWETDENGNYILNDPKIVEYRESKINNLKHFEEIPIEKIINLIEENTFSNRKEVSELLRRVKKLKNSTQEIENEIRYKAKELGIDLTKYTQKSIEEITREIEFFNGSYEEYYKLKLKIKSWKNATDDDVERLKTIARNLGVPTNRREEFYYESLNLINFNSINELISDFDSLKNVPGVWRVEGVDGITYDVAQTRDIGGEMFEYLRRLNFNKGLTDKEIERLNVEKQTYNRKKYRDITLDCEKFNFVLEVRDVKDLYKREIIEVQIAHDRKAKYWSPAPGQLKRLKERRGNNYD